MEEGLYYYEDDVSFPGYVVQSNRAGAPFYAFVLIYSFFAFFLIAPLVSWSRTFEKQDRKEQQQDDSESPNLDGDERESQRVGGEKQSQQAKSESQYTGKEYGSKKAESSVATSRKTPSAVSGTRSGFGLLVRELDKVAAAEYPNLNPTTTANTTTRRAGGSRVSTEHSSGSGAVSAATTSFLHASPNNKRLSTLVLDVGGRRWKHRRPIGRADTIQRAINAETGSLISRSGGTSTSRKRPVKGMSDVASSVLSEESKGMGPIRFNRPATSFRNRFSRSRGGSVRSDRSIMSSIIDDISPNDAADADDPGRGNIFVQNDRSHIRDSQKKLSLSSNLGCVSSLLEGLLEVATPGDEIKRVASSSLPLSIGAMSEALFRIIIAAFVSNYIGSDSMIAYLLVGLFVRLSIEEISGAVVDALSSFLQTCLFSGESDASYKAGQYIQLAVLLQLLLGIPLLVMWYYCMEPVVLWLVDSLSIASISSEYARIVVFNFLVQAVAQTITVVFPICGHQQFESVIDFSASAVQVIVVSCVVALVDDVTLTTVGYIQVIIGVAAAVIKGIFPVMRGWTKPFRKGMVGNVALFKNFILFWELSRATAPLLVGSFLEYGEWEVLTLCLRRVGPAEVATWALLGAIWDVLEAYTEGIGEAASAQVDFLLAAAHPNRARKLCNSVIYLAIVQSLLITSGLFMSGRYLAVLLSSDPTIQNMTNEVIPVLGLANLCMGCSQISWSLIGAQGRYRLATSVVFFSRWLVTIPMALICIFVFFLDLSSVVGSLVVGYSTASCALTFIVLRSDWDLLSKAMQEVNCQPLMDDVDEYDEDEDDSSSDDDSDGFF